MQDPTVSVPSSVNDYTPPVVTDSLPPAPPEPLSDLPEPTPAPEIPMMDAAVEETPMGSTPSEDIADLNIFDMLGVKDGTPEQRDQFLNELQAVIWDDFIDHDTKLLLTEDEQKQLASILQPDPKSPENQEKAVVFLETLVPDLEEIMLEKALQLKEEMVRERLKAMQELHREDASKMGNLTQVEQLFNKKQWRSGSDLLNSIR